MKISSQSWQAQLNHESAHPSPIAPEAHDTAKHPSSSLIEKVKTMQLAINRLESERDNLSHTVSDLKQLIQRLSLEQKREAERSLRISQDLSQKAKRLENSLEISREYGDHFQKIKSFWVEFIE
ncbi:unnamed protein product [Blepharisma stoltei]|uniref:Uncharacterized protein n=1 Tax=Blepharisma stoltei TaxID=1481888 RepID=A0AAU9JY27_9CILI|nr:unnamed protein product [Blepharisma stoltei]